MDGSTSLDTSTSRDEGDQTDNHPVRKVFRTNARSRNLDAGSSSNHPTQHIQQQNEVKSKDANLSPIIRHDGGSGESPDIAQYKLTSQISSQSIENNSYLIFCSQYGIQNNNGGCSPMQKPISPSVNIKRLASDLHKQAFMYNNQSRISNQNSADASPNSFIHPIYIKGAPSGTNVIGIKSQKRYLSIMGAGGTPQTNEDFQTLSSAQKNPAYIHKRQYDKAFEKFKVLEQGLNLRNSYGKGLKTSRDGQELSSLPMSWEQTDPSLQQDLTLSMVSSARANKYILTAESKNMTLSHFKLPSAELKLSVSTNPRTSTIIKASSIGRRRGGGEASLPPPPMSVQHTNLHSANGTQYGGPSSQSLLPLLLMNPHSVETEIFRRQKKRENEHMRQRIKELELKAF